MLSNESFKPWDCVFHVLKPCVPCIETVRSIYWNPAFHVLKLYVPFIEMMSFIDWNRNETHLLRGQMYTRSETSVKFLILFVYLKYLCTAMVWNRSYPFQVFQIYLAQRKVRQTFFSQINIIIDWSPIRGIIEIAYTKDYKSTGWPSYDSLI